MIDNPGFGPHPPEWMELIERVLAGEATPEEGAALRRWLAGDPRRGDLFLALKDALQPASQLHADVDPIWQQLERRLARPAVAPAAPRGGMPWSMPLALAATLALFIAGGLLLSGRKPDARLASPRVFSTRAGERAWVNLPDSSRILLSPLTTLTVDAPSDSTRGATLDGEAYFEVRHDPAHPFRVRARGTVSTVLGTHFVIRARAGQDTVELAVSSGRVRFARTGDTAASLVVDSAQAGHAFGSAPLHLQRRIDLVTRLAWTGGRLVFDRASLATVAADLGRWFGLDIALADSVLARRSVTASFTLATADQALNAVAAVTGARVQRQGRHVVLHSTRTSKGY